MGAYKIGEGGPENVRNLVYHSCVSQAEDLLPPRGWRSILRVEARDIRDLGSA